MAYCAPMENKSDSKDAGKPRAAKLLDSPKRLNVKGDNKGKGIGSKR